MKYLRKHWLAISMLAIITGNMIRAIVSMFQDFSLAYGIFMEALLFSIMIVLIGWLINYFRTHRKVRKV